MVVAKLEKQTLNRDDLIEFILRSVPEEKEFRIYESKHTIAIWVDKDKLLDITT